MIARDEVDHVALVSEEAGGDGGSPPPATTLIPGGTFAFHDAQTGNATMATITHDFYLDTTEVAVGRFQAWVTAGQTLPCGGASCSLDPEGPYEQAMMWQSSWNASSPAALSPGSSPTSTRGRPQERLRVTPRR